MERVGPVAPARDPDGLAGADQDDLVDEPPFGDGRAAAAVQRLIDPGVGHGRECRRPVELGDGDHVRLAREDALHQARLHGGVRVGGGVGEDVERVVAV